MDFYLSTLNQQEQDYYHRIRAAFANQQERVRLPYASPLNGKHIQNACFAVMFDCPELFYVNPSFSARGAMGSVTLSSKFIYDRQEIIDDQNIIQGLLNKFSRDYKGKDITEILESLMNYFIEETTYAVNSLLNQNAASILVYKEGQCSGYANATNLILKELGYEGIFVKGQFIEENKPKIEHAWLLIKISDKYYHFDPTFCVTLNKNNGCLLDKSYFLKSNKTFAKDHVWDTRLLPNCDDDYPLRSNNSRVTRSQNQATTDSVINQSANGYKIVNNVLDFRKFFKQEYQSGKRQIEFNSNIPDYQGNELIRLLQGAIKASLAELRVRAYSYKINTQGTLVSIILS